MTTTTEIRTLQGHADRAYWSGVLADRLATGARRLPPIPRDRPTLDQLHAATRT